MGDDKDYTITITNPSEDIGGWDSNITINGMSYSAPSIDMISTSTVDLNTESYVSDTGGEYTFNMPSSEIFVDSMPSASRIDEMCDLYPALAKAYEQFKLIYKMTEQDFKGKLKEKIETNKALGLLSKKLARIMLDVPVHFDSNEYKLSDPNIIAVSELFQELEFRRLSETFVKVFKPTEATPESTKTETKAATAAFDLFNQPGSGQIESMSAFKSLDTVSHHYQCVQTELERELLLQTMQRQKSVCFDTETTGLDAVSASLIGIAFSWQAHTGYYVPIPDDADARKAILDSLIPFFEDEAIEKVGQNLKYDLKVMQQHGISVKGKLFDTMLAHYIINPDMRHNMDVLAETYLNYTPQPITELIGKKGKNQKSMRDVDLKSQTEYGVEDADITFQLKTLFENELEDANTRKLFNEIEIPLVEVLADMELEGIKLDENYLQSLSEALTNDIKDLETKIYEEAGEEFLISSPKQLGIILFEKLELSKKPKKTKTGQYSTSEDVLSVLAEENPIVQHVLDYRGLVKLQNTYVDALPNQVEKTTGRVHTEYVQTIAATGRLSSNNPNLQNIPIRTERGRQVRKAFVPRDENFVLLAADYSQIELRIIAALSDEENMIKAFKEGEDIHASTAAKVFNVPLEEVTREQRSNAKTVNFGIIYGVSAFGLSNQTSLSRSEAKDLIDTYYKTYPKLSSYIADQVEFARQNGYVSTVLGRRRYLKDINSRNQVVRGAAERNAVNAPIQGSAADIIKLAMINIHNKLKAGNYKTRMLLQVHDELVFDAHKEEMEEMKTMIRTEMENAYKLQVPLDVEIGIGQNWLEAH